jgi:hypothetical protein
MVRLAVGVRAMTMAILWLGMYICSPDYTSQATAYQARPKRYLTTPRNSLIILGNK